MHVPSRWTALCLVPFLLHCTSSNNADSGSTTPLDATTDVAALPDSAPVPDAPSADGGPNTACNPLGYDTVCAAPFPSAYAMATDSTTATGMRLALTAAGMPVTRGANTHVGMQPLDVSIWNRYDGFSPSAPAVAYFPESLDANTLIAPDHIASSVMPGASTAIVDMETHERIVHMSELDMTAMGAGQHQTLIIRPLVRLKPGHRYAVAITSALHTTSGSAPAIPPGFQAILDGHPERDARLAAIAPRYTEIFAALQSAGIQRSDLVLAWDYVTASERFLTGETVAMRDRAAAAIATTPVAVNITSVEGMGGTDGGAPFNTNIARRIRGTFDVPMFLTNGGASGSRLTRDADMMPVPMGVAHVPFVAMVPMSVETGTGPFRTILFGHGLFGSGEGELGDASDTTNYVQRFLNDRHIIAFATNWIGLSTDDRLDAISALSNWNNLPVITERLQQSLVNAMTLFTKMKTVNQAPFHAGGVASGALLIDPTLTYYYGISLGGIMGGSFMGYSTDCDRGVLNVNGGNWSLLIQRSSAYAQFELPLTDYPARSDRQILLVLAQSLFDLSDPINAAPHWLANPLPGATAKHVLSQMGLHDATVTNVATEMVARTAGLPLLLPSVSTPFGLTTMNGPLDSAFTIWDRHDMPYPSLTNVVPMVNDTHTGTRDIARLKDQIDAFLSPTGQVVSTCDGVCDPN